MSERSSRSWIRISRAARSAFLHNLRELNLFSNDPFWTPTLNSSEQLLSTRLFLFFLSVSLLIVISFASLLIQTHTVTQQRFSLAELQSLQARYPTSINVPCTQVSIPYHKFMRLSPSFHQVCSSAFVSEQWISSLFLPNATVHNIYDFRTFTFAQFQALALLCHTARQAITDGLRTFNATNLVTNYLFTRAEFDEISHGLFNNLRNNILASENRTARIVSMSIAQNRLISALRTNIYIRSVYLSNLFITYNGHYLKKNGTSWSPCRCPLESHLCVYPAGDSYNWTTPPIDTPIQALPPPSFQIPGLMAGCLPFESMRQSTLACLYKQSCVDVLSLQPGVSRPKALRKSPSRLPPNATIGTMFDQFLFVESWHTQTSFNDYFAACAPRALTYSYRGRSRPPSIVTICISAFGGLVIVWQVLTPAMVHVWTFIRRKTPSEDSPEQPVNKAVKAHVYRTIHTFNLFPAEDDSDVEGQRGGIIATRLYLLFLLLGLLALGFYTSLSKRTQQYTVRVPTLLEFDRLQSLYSSTLVCSCSRFSMSHNRILSISPRYHQICSSSFLNDSWLAYFDVKEVNVNSTFFPVIDFRYGGPSFFDLLRVLCQTAEETVNNALHLFRSRRLVTVTTLSRLQFNHDMQTRLQQFEQQTISSFVNLLELIRSATQTNRLVSDLLTTTGFSYLLNKQTMKYSPRFYSRTIDSCSCAVSSNCTRPQGFYLQSDHSNSHPNVTIPGLVLGCYTVDSLLFSTLECLFEQDCLNLLIDMRDFDANGLFHPMDSRVARIPPLRRETSRFPPNITLEWIVAQLFVEDWRTSKNFTAYYHRCAPRECTYSLTRRFDTAYMVAMMLGFYSGLSAILEILLPPCVRCLRQQWQKRSQRIETAESTACLERAAPRSFDEVYKSFLSWNLFSNERSTIDSTMKQQEIVATRFYYILFLLGILAALLYAGPLSEETNTIVIKRPTADVVNQLYAKNISTLSCPCSTAAVPHSHFLSIVPEYHSVCSSSYITPTYWIDLSKKTDKVSTLLTAHYRLLASLCQSAERAIRSAQDVFYAQELVTLELMSRSSFSAQTNALVSTFISQIPADHRRTSDFIVRSFAVNQLFNVFTSNWKLDFTDEDQQHVLATYPRRFPSSSCTCATSSDCTEPVTEDIVSGCFPFDGVRLSTFENLSLGQLNDDLFVTAWRNQSNYTAYFQTCQPLECRYTLADRNNPIFMFMTVLGLYGGLICILRLAVDQSLHACRWWSQQGEEQQMETSAADPIA